MWDGINCESVTDMDTLTDEQDPLYSTGISAQYSYNKTILHHTFQSPYLYFLYSQANDLYWKVSYDKSRHILKSKDHFANKGTYSQSHGFSTVMYRWENWTLKKVEGKRINAFKFWLWRRLESPLDCKEIKPVHPKE